MNVEMAGSSLHLLVLGFSSAREVMKYSSGVRQLIHTVE